MATDKWVARLEAKLDALLKHAGIKPDDVVMESAAAPVERKLTEMEQQAIDNAPKTPTTEPLTAEAARRARVDAVTNAPDTSSSVPKEAESRGLRAAGAEKSPEDSSAFGPQPAAHSPQPTMPASEARRKR